MEAFGAEHFSSLASKAKGPPPSAWWVISETVIPKARANFNRLRKVKFRVPLSMSQM